jgi:hypothetical protein
VEEPEPVPGEQRRRQRGDRPERSKKKEGHTLEEGREDSPVGEPRAYPWGSRGLTCGGVGRIYLWGSQRTRLEGSRRTLYTSPVGFGCSSNTAQRKRTEAGKSTSLPPIPLGEIRVMACRSVKGNEVYRRYPRVGKTNNPSQGEVERARNAEQ